MRNYTTETHYLEIRDVKVPSVLTAGGTMAQHIQVSNSISML